MIFGTGNTYLQIHASGIHSEIVVCTDVFCTLINGLSCAIQHFSFMGINKGEAHIYREDCPFGTNPLSQ